MYMLASEKPVYGDRRVLRAAARVVQRRGAAIELHIALRLAPVGERIERLVTEVPAELELVAPVHLGEVLVGDEELAVGEVLVNARVPRHLELRGGGIVGPNPGEAALTEGVREPQLAGVVVQPADRHLTVVIRATS